MTNRINLQISKLEAELDTIETQRQKDNAAFHSQVQILQEKKEKLSRVIQKITTDFDHSRGDHEIAVQELHTRLQDSHSQASKVAAERQIHLELVNCLEEHQVRLVFF